MNRVRKGDRVEVIAGDEKGARGIVRQVLPRKNRVIVEGINLVKKHQRAIPTRGATPVQAGIIEFEAPIHISNVAPVCPSCDRWTRVGYRVRPDGSKTRVCKRCGAEFD